jgi:AAA15 family ATPase/GTPase
MSDTNKHLTYFKVENFKRFESFEMGNLGQFNLIVGDNNVGKTSVLEALLVDRVARISTNAFATILNIRQLSNRPTYSDLINFANGSLFNENTVVIRFYLNDTDESPIQLSFDRDKYNFSFHGGVIKNKDNSLDDHLNHEIGISTFYKIPYIPFGKGYEIKTSEVYKLLQGSKLRKGKFIESLKLLVPTLNNIEPNASNLEKLVYQQDHLDYSLPLEFFGDGTLKLFRILSEIIAHKDSRLMIDEIDTGIHYSRMQEFWGVVLNSARMNNVQLFMTTHNKECIQAFVEAFSELELKGLRGKARNITLVETKDKEVKAFTYSFDQLEHAVTVGNEIRA